MSTRKTETSSGFSLQPDLFNRMYDDGKSSYKKNQKDKEIKKKREENKKRREESKKKLEEQKTEREKNKPMSRNEKITYTVIICLSALISVPLSIYFSASLLNKLKKATGENADLNLKTPDYELSKPYKNQSREAALKEAAKADGKFSESIKNSVKGGGRRRKYQKGGNMMNDFANESKGFLDSTKYGFPYNLAYNDNPFIADFGRFFITYMSFQRKIFVKIMTTMNDFYFKSFDPEKGKGGFTSNIGNKIIDWLTFAFVLPTLNSFSTLISIASSTIGLFWAAINNQSVGMIPWLIFSFVTVFWGGNWPTTWIMVPYKDIYIAANGASSSFDIFKTYFSRYIFWWLLLIFLIWGGAIWGFMGGGFGKNIKREYDYTTWIVAGFGVPMAVWLISLVGFAAIFGHDSDKS
jgi:hypothetical protein